MRNYARILTNGLFNLKKSLSTNNLTAFNTAQQGRVGFVLHL